MLWATGDPRERKKSTFEGNMYLIKGTLENIWMVKKSTSPQHFFRDDV